MKREAFLVLIISYRSLHVKKLAQKIPFVKLVNYKKTFFQWSPLLQEPEAPQNYATSRGLRRITPGSRGIACRGINKYHTC